MKRRVQVGSIYLLAAAVLGTLVANVSHAEEKLPADPQPFKGRIELRAKDSVAAWPEPAKPPQGAPNVLVILLDDVGFGATSSFGGPVATAALDRVAQNGLRYNRFHVVGICTPTRASLLTGRNHQSVGMALPSEIATGYPGYNTMLGRDSATIARILKEHGYGTAWFGKNHL
ncbi:arylsulfatase, putative, partial [Ricinus communis]